MPNSQNKMQQVFLISATFQASPLTISLFIYVYIYINPQLRLGVDSTVEFPGTLRDDKLEIPNIPGEHHYSALGKETSKGLAVKKPCGVEPGVWQSKSHQFGTPFLRPSSGWWQLKYFDFLPKDPWERIQFGRIFFQMG